MDDSNHREELFSRAVRAGKRTYFFDVKTTRGNDLYLTVTESKKRYDKDGSGKFFYEKHKLFLYKEDFDKFLEGLNDSIAKIDELRASGNFKEDEVYESNYESETIAAEPASDNGSSDDNYDSDTTTDNEDGESNQFTDISFEDLDEESNTQ